MDRYRSLSDQIAYEVEKALKYHKHYIGQVSDNDDPSKKGRVRVMVPELGWDSQDRAQWCWPRQGFGMNVPLVDQWVEVWFIAGDRNRAVYLGLAAEITGHTPDAYSAPKQRVLFQDPTTKDSIIYDAEDKTFTLTFDQDTLVIDRQNRTLEVDMNGNVLKMESGKVTINGNLEVSQ